MALSNSDRSFLESFICECMAEWHIPGLAIAVARENDIVMQLGLGQRDFSSETAVDLQTLFPTGSLTKAFTTTAIAMLVEQRILDWDWPIKRYVPDFQMYDKTASDQVTLRDIACHRSGLPRHDLAWYAPVKNRAELVHRIRYLPPSQPFRSAFQYNNLMYTVAGYVVESVLGISWEEFVKQSITKPLGMSNTSFDLLPISGVDNYAVPHRVMNDQVYHTSFLDLSAVGPAGSIVSNIEDMTRWLSFHISGGEGAPEIISRRALIETHSPHMAFSIPPDVSREIPIQTYGLGWSVTAYRGFALVSHDGWVDGFSAYISFIPQEKCGLVILANLEDCQSVLRVIGRTILDYMLGLDRIDWNARTKARIEGNRTANADRDTPLGTQLVVPASICPYSQYIGEYRDGGYGALEIGLENKQLYVRFYRFLYQLRWLTGDSFKLEKNEACGGDANTIGDAVTFGRDSENNVDSVTIKMEPALNAPEVVFKRLV